MKRLAVMKNETRVGELWLDQRRRFVFRYDLISTLVYPDLSPKMAMKIGKENRFKWLREIHWTRFAEGIGVKPGFLFSTARSLSEKVVRKADEMSQRVSLKHGGESVIGDICNIVVKHANYLSRS